MNATDWVREQIVNIEIAISGKFGKEKILQPWKESISHPVVTDSTSSLPFLAYPTLQIVHLNQMCQITSYTWYYKKPHYTVMKMTMKMTMAITMTMTMAMTMTTDSSSPCPFAFARELSTSSSLSVLVQDCPLKPVSSRLRWFGSCVGRTQVSYQQPCLPSSSFWSLWGWCYC